MLKIINVNASTKNVCTMRYYMDSDRVEKYNEKFFDGHEWIGVPSNTIGTNGRPLAKVANTKKSTKEPEDPWS
jgi:hypothetical protein